MTANPETETRAESSAEKAEGFVRSRAASLQSHYLEGDPSARAALAQLRHATSADPGTAWKVGEYLIPDFLPNNDPDTETYGQNRYDRVEIAVHIAMTSFAQLQQSKGVPMHVQGRGLGEAARKLADDPNEHMERGAVWERLAKVAQAESVAGLQRQLRNLVGLFERRGIGLDFGILAKDLYFWQNRPTRANVQRNWSRDFFRYRKDSDSATVAPSQA
ncbi:type I-E CRISPR-associated protein Cse2/CasB [Brevibacterium sp. 50QC2O2]|uniref:type I-E CRISPR-associated protein Cse2/CasB n=1 Tax=Brevibacterium sp. 50QC2O2 TaxID=2968459 RepID=UPI00211D005E|nr:type I-E CRISPR-associated protein Cse2/CasB [Brevibacterium sp. 50QC2O2]MCQ9387257.1 type I-E CRISPR-associated protein Cse2/CasB [Brevibacterium sp. 50QC2O2]